MSNALVHFAYADVGDGQIHYAECGPREAVPVLLLHQTPRSWAEYRDVLPLLGERYRAIAMDTAGFGASTRLPGEVSIERWAQSAIGLLDALGIASAHVVGHHTGGVIAMEIAAEHPARVNRLVLSSTPYTDAGFRRERAQRPPDRRGGDPRRWRSSRRAVAAQTALLPGEPTGPAAGLRVRRAEGDRPARGGAPSRRALQDGREDRSHRSACAGDPGRPRSVCRSTRAGAVRAPAAGEADRHRRWHGAAARSVARGIRVRRARAFSTQTAERALLPRPSPGYGCMLIAPRASRR